MSASKPRKQRKPVSRSVRLLPDTTGQAGWMVRIQVGKDVTLYFLDVLATDYGAGYALEKIGSETPNPVYHVCINGTDATCECKGFIRWKRCKHVDGIRALKAAGKLGGV